MTKDQLIAHYNIFTWLADREYEEHWGRANQLDRIAAMYWHRAQAQAMRDQAQRTAAVAVAVCGIDVDREFSGIVAPLL